MFYEKIALKSIASLLVLFMGLSFFAIKTEGLASSYSIDTFVSIAGAVADHIDRTGTFPTSVVFNNQAYSVQKGTFYGLALASINAIYNGTTSVTITKINGETTPNILNYTDSFNQVIISKEAYMNTVARNIAWVQSANSFDGGYHYYGAYTTYPGGGYIFTGNFSFIRALCTYARILRHYNDNNELPDFVDCTDLRAVQLTDGIYRIKNDSVSTSSLKITNTETSPQAS